MSVEDFVSHVSSTLRSLAQRISKKLLKISSVILLASTAWNQLTRIIRYINLTNALRED